MKLPWIGLMPKPIESCQAHFGIFSFFKPSIHSLFPDLDSVQLCAIENQWKPLILNCNHIERWPTHNGKEMRWPVTFGEWMETMMLQYITPVWSTSWIKMLKSKMPNSIQNLRIDCRMILAFHYHYIVVCTHDIWKKSSKMIKKQNRPYVNA